MKAPESGYHILTCDGDGAREVEALIEAIGSAEKAGLHRQFFVTRANQTVVMTATADSPLALALRKRPGWQEPSEDD
ncbi:MAG TPA: hypothetical protein VMN39_05335 [Longimicrobiaceae bacterium]|nr:hypothetical protein [Longimicrobiaceae bacterium]